MSELFSVAVVGATGAIGESVVACLEERKFPVDELFVVASERSAGTPISFGKRNPKIKNLADFDFSKVQLVFFCVPAEVSAEYVPHALEAGCYVIDTSSAFVGDESSLLVSAGVNDAVLEGITAPQLIVAPSATSSALIKVLHPIQQVFGVVRIHSTCMQSVSSHGHRGLEELGRQTASLLNFQQIKPDVFPQQIAFNVLPQFGDVNEQGYTHDEMNVVVELQRLVGDDDLPVNISMIQVPTFYGSTQVVQLETREPFEIEQVQQLLSSQAQLKVDTKKDPSSMVTAVGQAGENKVAVSRVRQDLAEPYGLSLCIVADNIRQGSALSSVQIAEILVKSHL